MELVKNLAPTQSNLHNLLWEKVHILVFFILVFKNSKQNTTFGAVVVITNDFALNPDKSLQIYVV